MTAAPEAVTPPTGLKSAPGGESTAGSREVGLAIEGMTCAACAVRIEKKLNKLDEVRATVNYATATARVTVPASLPVAELIAAVERGGGRAGPPPPRPPASAQRRRPPREDRVSRLPRTHGTTRPTGTLPTCAVG